jgi:hypothetical protein
MRSLDAADLPRCVHLRDTSRRYQGLAYNCTFAPPLPAPAPAKSPRPSASDKSSGGTEAAARHAEHEKFRLSREAARDKEADEQETQEALEIHRQVYVKK